MSKSIEKKYFFICENVIKDFQTGAMSFINVKNSFGIESLPIVVGGFFFVAGFKLNYPSAQIKEELYSQLKIISPDNKIILDIKQAVQFEHNSENRLPGVDFVFKIDRLQCEVTGIYRVQVIDFPNEIILAEMEFEVVFPPSPRIKYKSPEEIEKLLERKDIIKKVDFSVNCLKCKHDKKFTLSLERDMYKMMEQELSLPENFIYICENCGQWKIHLGRIITYMYNKLGQKA